MIEGYGLEDNVGPEMRSVFAWIATNVLFAFSSTHDFDNQNAQQRLTRTNHKHLRINKLQQKTTIIRFWKFKIACICLFIYSFSDLNF